MFLFLSIPYVSAAPTQPPQAPTGTKEELIAYATNRAVEARIEPSVVLAVIDCETGSTWNPTIAGDHGKSHGLVQIYAPAHPDISLEKAENPYFAISYLVSELKQGHGNQWTCWRNR